MENAVVIVLIAIAVIASGIFVFSLASMGSKCAEAEDAAYREYLLKKKTADTAKEEGKE